MKRKISTFLFGLMFLIGFGILAYPTISNQWNTYRQSKLISDYDDKVSRMTEEDFEETMDVVRRVEFDSAFTFLYSRRTGTPAAVMEEQVPEETMKNRFDRLLSEVQQISARVCARDLHTTRDVLVESLDDHLEGYVTGRLSNNTIVHFPGDASLIGTIVPVYLEESRGFYYMGTAG